MSHTKEVVTPPQPAVAHATVSTILTTIAIPAIGTHWLEQGGIYAGILRGKDGAPDEHTIVAPEETLLNYMSWTKAMEECSKPTALHSDWHLADRRESSLASINVPELFNQDDWYWTSTQYAAGSGYAWVQDFSGGGQDGYRKSSEYRARAVRRFSII